MGVILNRSIFYGIMTVRSLINLFNIHMEAYCVKCKAKREMKDAKEVLMNGKGGKTRNAMTGVCPVCGTKMFRIMGAKKD